jgi:hypothetical protein
MLRHPFSNFTPDQRPVRNGQNGLELKEFMWVGIGRIMMALVVQFPSRSPLEGAGVEDSAGGRRDW